LCGGSAGTDTNGRLPLPEEPGNEKLDVPDAAEALHIRSTRKWAVKKDLSISIREQTMRGGKDEDSPLTTLNPTKFTLLWYTGCILVV